MNRILMFIALALAAMTPASNARSLRSIIWSKCDFECPENSVRKKQGKGIPCYKDFGT